MQTPSNIGDTGIKIGATGKDYRWFRFNVALLWLLASIYFGLGCWEGVTLVDLLSETPNEKVEKSISYYEPEDKALKYPKRFTSERSLNIYLRQQQDQKLFPWFRLIFAGGSIDGKPMKPIIDMYWLSAFAFGALGGAAQLVRMTVRDGSFGVLNTIALPLLSGIIGIMIFFMSKIVPAFLTKGESDIRIETLCGVSLFAGFFSDRAMNWIEAQTADRIFPTKPQGG